VQVKFVVVYQREPHARQLAFRDVAQPETFGERAALARRMLEELELDVEVWVDDLGDTSRATFGDLPSWAVMISHGGTIMRKLAWPEPESLEAFVKDLPAPDLSNTYPTERVRANRIKFSLARAKQLRSKPLHELAPATAARLHERRAHLAFLVETAPEHPSRPQWLQELAGDGPAYQRAWALAQRAPQPTDPGDAR
jgi:hypothetical protein